MSFLSSIKSKVSSSYNAVKSTVKGLAQSAKDSLSRQKAAVGDLIPAKKSTGTPGLDFSNPANQTLQTKRSNPTIPLPIAPGGYTADPNTGTKSERIARATASQPFIGPQLPRTINANTYGGVKSTASSTSVSLSPDVARTLTSGTLGSSSLSGGSAGVSTGGVSSGVNSSVGYGTGTAGIDNTKMSGALAGYYKYNDKGILEPVQDPALDAQAQKEKAAEDQANFFDKYFQEKPSVYADREVRDAMKQKKQIQDALLAPTAELNAIVAKQQQDLLQTRQNFAKEGATEADYGQASNAINYGASIRALPVQASIANLQGQLELAQDYLKELTAMKTDEINRQYDYNKSRFAAISGALDKADQRAYESITKENDRQYKEQIDLENYKAEVMATALKNGAGQFELGRINTATDKMSAVQAAGKYIANADTQLTQLDNGETVLVDKRTGKIISNIGGAKATGSASFAGLTPAQAADPFVQKLANSAGGKPLTDTFAQKLDKGLTVLGQIGLLQNNIKDVKTGPIAGAFKGANPWDTSAQTIKAQLNAIVPNLARGVYGEVGVLTDNDIAQYSKTLPNLKSTEDIRNAVLGITVDLIGKSIKRTLEVNAANGKDVSGFIDLYTEMQNTRDGIFQQIPGYKGGGTASAPKEGDTKDYNGVTYVVKGGNWVPK
jgi:hypothetical protein